MTTPAVHEIGALLRRIRQLERDLAVAKETTGDLADEVARLKAQLSAIAPDHPQRD